MNCDTESTMAYDQHLADAEARIRRLQDALRPFAEKACVWIKEDPSLCIQLLAYDDGPAPCINVEAFRRAYDAMTSS